MLGSIWLLASLAFTGHHGQLRNFEGLWGVDMAAEERSSDAGPFFNRFSLRQRKTGIQQELHLLHSLKGGTALSLFYPANGSSAEASVDGHALYTSSSWRGQDLILDWEDKQNGGKRMRSVLTFSPDRRTITLSIFLRENQSFADLVVVLRRLDRNGKFGHAHNR